MYQKRLLGLCAAGFLAGIVNGLFGAGGGMVLVPLLTMVPGLSETEVFPSSVAIILPICIISLIFILPGCSISIISILPYLIGSFLGGILSWKFGRRIPTVWLHRLLGAFILWGGIRYLC